MTTAENGTKNIDHKTNKRKLAKEFNADKNMATASITNALDDGDITKDDLMINRPKKKGGRKKIRNKQKKLQQRIDGFFCGAPSEFLNANEKFRLNFNQMISFISTFRSRIYAHGIIKNEW